MWIIGTLIIVFCLKGRSVGQCGGQVWKKVDIDGGHMSDWFQVLENQSISGCSEACTRESQCRSFGVDVINGKCFLYKFLVWSGGNVLQNQNPVLHYWGHQKVCPDNYIYEESVNVCYKFSSDEKEWSEAFKTCQQDNGLLAMADTSAKRDFLRQVVRSNGNPSKIYVGTTDQNNEGIWKWQNGVTVTNWNTNEPNNFNNLQHCGVLEGGYNMDDEYCDRDKYFICEIPMV